MTALLAEPFTYGYMVNAMWVSALVGGVCAFLSAYLALSRCVVASTRVGDRRWNLHLDNRIEVWLPEQDAVAAWRLLAQKAQDEALLDRAVSVIDLRFLPDRIRLRLDAAALEAGHT